MKSIDQIYRSEERRKWEKKEHEEIVGMGEIGKEHEEIIILPNPLIPTTSSISKFFSLFSYVVV